MNDLARVVDTARQALAPLLDRSGNILYSAASTLRPGPVYLLGLNPGGDPTGHETIREMLERLPSRTANAYLDESWERQSCPGQAQLQQRVAWLLQQLGLQVRDVCASNLIFTRSKATAGAGYPQTADMCWPVHDTILDIVRPRLVVAYGNSSMSPY